jgi:SAM-dependent methyltransferase
MSLSLRCPRCTATLPEISGTTVLSCDCSRYPQIDGVPTIKSSQDAMEEIESAAKAIEAGGRLGAIEWMRKWWDVKQCPLELLSGVLTDSPVLPGRTFVEDWQRFAGVGRENYFILRWACPSFLCNLPLLPYLAGKRILDLGAGVGHFAHLTSLVSPSVEIVAADGTLLHNLVLRKYFAPKAKCVCLDLEEPLPFPDLSFDAVVLNDSFHYVTNKRGLLEEAFRLLKEDGFLALIHVHDPRDLSGERVPGEALEPRECFELIYEVQPKAFIGALDEHTFLENYFHGEEVELVGWLKKDYKIEPGPYLVFASKDTGCSFGNSLLHKQELFGVDKVFLNPVYNLSLNEDELRFTLDWPNRSVFEEFGRFQYLPEQVKLRRDAGPVLLEHLRRAGVLIPDPEGALSIPFTDLF